ncbi:MAG: DUF4406 domain-containing protein [Candidatus Coatesbacteria bacterium]
MGAASKRPFIFVTGPYSAPTPEGEARNIQRAIDVGRAVFEKGYYPIVPHVLVREFYVHGDTQGLFGYEPLMQYTLAMIPRCDALLLYDRSPGADREYDFAKQLGKPVYRDVSELPRLDD